MKYKHQFYLEEHPKEIDPDDQYIRHTKFPRFVAKILSFQDEFEIAMQEWEGENITFFYINADSLREVYCLVIVEKFDEAESEKFESKLKRMADWWTDYLMWEDRQQVGAAGKASSLQDWNESTPGLKIIYSSNRWMIIYKGIVKTFEDEYSMDNYLMEKFNLTEEQLDKGILNTLS